MMLRSELVALGELRTSRFRGMKRPSSDAELRILEEYRQFLLNGGDMPEHRNVPVLQRHQEG